MPEFPVYTAKFYIDCLEIAHLQLDQDVPRWHVPDIVFVTGDVYLDENVNVTHKVGSSFRHAKLLKRTNFTIVPSDILVLMSYMESSAGFTQQIALRTQPAENLFFCSI